MAHHPLKVNNCHEIAIEIQLQQLGKQEADALMHHGEGEREHNRGPAHSLSLEQLNSIKPGSRRGLKKTKWQPKDLLQHRGVGGGGSVGSRVGSECGKPVDRQPCISFTAYVGLASKGFEATYLYRLHVEGDVFGLTTRSRMCAL